MANAKRNTIVNKQTKLEQFTALKQELTNEWAEIETEMAELRQTFDQRMEELNGRIDQLREALFSEVKFEEEPLKNEQLPLPEEPTQQAAFKDGPTSNAEKLIEKLREYPGASKNDLRGLLPKFKEVELERAMAQARKAKLIENRGNRAKPEWHVV